MVCYHLQCHVDLSLYILLSFSNDDRGWSLGCGVIVISYRKPRTIIATKFRPLNVMELLKWSTVEIGRSELCFYFGQLDQNYVMGCVFCCGSYPRKNWPVVEIKTLDFSKKFGKSHKRKKKKYRLHSIWILNKVFYWRE